MTKLEITEMSFGNIKRRPADILFSQYLRKKIGKCEVCGRRGEGKDGIAGLVVSHFHGRRGESTRFSSENCSVCCINCHRIWHEKPLEYVEWMKKKLGEKRFKLLTLAANRYCKRDDKLQLIIIKELMKELNK